MQIILFQKQMGTRRQLVVIGKSKQCGDNVFNCTDGIGSITPGINFQRVQKSKKKRKKERERKKQTEYTEKKKKEAKQTLYW